MINILGNIPKKITVAVSGGADSMAVLSFLSSYRKRDVSVAYFNHGTTFGKDSEVFIRRYCSTHELPLTVGMIGSTDAHTSIPSTEEDNFYGKISAAEPSGSPLRYEELVNGRLSPDPETKTRLYESMAGGLTAIWARENTRESLWNAMAAKEVLPPREHA